jgi:hypothetical protein
MEAVKNVTEAVFFGLLKVVDICDLNALFTVVKV